MPQARAFWAVIILPVKTSSLALLGPIKPGQVLGAAKARHDAQSDFGQAEFGLLRGVDEVAGQGQFKAAPQGKAVHGGNDRLLHLFDKQHHPLTGAHKGMCRERRQAGHFLDVGPGHEGLFARAGNDDHLDRGVEVKLRKGRIPVRPIAELFSALSASGRLMVRVAMPSLVSSSRYLNSTLSSFSRHKSRGRTCGRDSRR